MIVAVHAKTQIKRCGHIFLNYYKEGWPLSNSMISNKQVITNAVSLIRAPLCHKKKRLIRCCVELNKAKDKIREINIDR